ncbi:MAG: hypothetical protein ABL997_14485 [Planctomycetota bacterium]
MAANAAKSPLAGLALLLLACSDEAPSGPLAVDHQTLVPAEVPALLLATCHGDLTGFERFAAKVTLPEGGLAQVFGKLPDHLRVQWPDGSIALLDRDRALQLGRDGGAAEELALDAATRLRAMRTLLDTAGLGPVRRATSCTRTGPQSFLLHQDDASVVDLELEPTALRVRRLGSVLVEEHLLTSTTQIVRIASIEPLGRCTIRFDKIDFALDETIFAVTPKSVPMTPLRPANNTADAKPSNDTVTVGAPSRPTEPVIEPVRAQRWLCLPDPGTWPLRAAAVQSHLTTLAKAGQATAGFQGLMREGDRTLLVVPFRQKDGASPFAQPAGWDVREVRAGRALAVYPASGDIDQRAAAGESSLRAALAAQDLVAAGSILVQPFLHLDEAAPDAEALKAPVVRVSILVK